MQRCPTVLIGRIYFRSLTQKNLHHLIMTVGRRDMQPGLPVTIRAMQQFRRSAQQQTHDSYVAAEASQMQGVPAILRRRYVYLRSKSPHMQTKYSMQLSLPF